MGYRLMILATSYLQGGLITRPLVYFIDHHINHYRNKMQKLVLYAQHADGRKLYFPQWNSSGDIINTRKPTAAVTIQNGVTFPPGSTWIRKPRGSDLEAGWKFSDQDQKTRQSVSENKVLTGRTMSQNSISPW